MVGGFHNIIHVHCPTIRADSVGFENIARLVVGQPTTLDVVGVVGQLDLHLVVDTAGGLCSFFHFQHFQ
ncbi:hypothetical protein SDC9_184045 [bioreactor metagenome]|uniref:Uncharacterized protein n=1 Tax=bioreactor metagenome TaxID=1076179 RepID=A0A645HDD0_9ZZZZ